MESLISDLNPIMTFPTQGQNHAGGIKNEKEIVRYMNGSPENIINRFLEKRYGSKIKNWTHQGGTQQKQDASVLFESTESTGISIKNHKSGTFDWLNTTKGVNDSLKGDISKFKDENLGAIIPKRGGVRSKLDNIFNSYLDSLSSKDISELLDKIYMNEENTRHIIINDRKKNRLIFFDESNLDCYCNTRWNHNFFLKSTSRAKTSRQIWIRSPDGTEINTNLRIRAHLNNGITALLGTSESNKTSVPCLKIQQDKVNLFIKRCFGKIIINL
jgi:predicted XRE-type DNA-binding protein